MNQEHSRHHNTHDKHMDVSGDEVEDIHVVFDNDLEVVVVGDNDLEVAAGDSDREVGDDLHMDYNLVDHIVRVVDIHGCNKYGAHDVEVEVVVVLVELVELAVESLIFY